MERPSLKLLTKGKSLLASDLGFPTSLAWLSKTTCRRLSPFRSVKRAIATKPEVVGVVVFLSFLSISWHYFLTRLGGLYMHRVYFFGALGFSIPVAVSCDLLLLCVSFSLFHAGARSRSKVALQNHCTGQTTGLKPACKHQKA